MKLEALLDRSPGIFGVYAKDLRSRRFFAHRAEEPFPAASTIKIPILIELYRRVEDEHLDLDARITMRDEDRVEGSGVLLDLTPGLSLCLRDLATLMISVSDNTATNLLIDYLGIDAVNRTGRDLGMRQTRLLRRLERVPPVLAGGRNVTTPRDLSRVMELLARGLCITSAASTRMVQVLKRCQGPLAIAPPVRPPRFVGDAPRPLVAHKTGSLSDACHDTGIVWLGDDAYVATIMSRGAPYDRLAPFAARIGRELARTLKQRDLPVAPGFDPPGTTLHPGS